MCILLIGESFRIRFPVALSVSVCVHMHPHVYCRLTTPVIHIASSMFS